MRSTQLLRSLALSLFVLSCLSIQSCKKKAPVLPKQRWATDLIIDTSMVSAYDRKLSQSSAHYEPDPRFPQLTPQFELKMNFHYMYDANGERNYPAEERKDVTWHFMNGSNKKLAKNVKMNLPLENETPVYDIPWRYTKYTSPGYEKEEGIYAHHDDDLYFFVHKGKHKNNYRREVITTYAIDDDSVINVFILPHHPDSVASKSYRPNKAGIALGTSLKVAGLFETGRPIWEFYGLFNHEVGHILGLRHTWASNDGCDDTPKHANCWNYSDSGPCKEKVSNNMMDYNSQQVALTPCQIGRVLKNVHKEGSKARKLVVPYWCNYDSTMSVTVREDLEWRGNYDLAGDLTIESGVTLKLYGRMSLPAGAKIVVMPGAKLIVDNGQLHQACGASWQGVELVSDDDGLSGELVLVAGATVEDALYTKMLTTKS